MKKETIIIMILTFCFGVAIGYIVVDAINEQKVVDTTNNNNNNNNKQEDDKSLSLETQHMLNMVSMLKGMKSKMTPEFIAELKAMDVSVRAEN